MFKKTLYCILILIAYIIYEELFYLSLILLLQLVSPSPTFSRNPRTHPRNPSRVRTVRVAEPTLL